MSKTKKKKRNGTRKIYPYEDKVNTTTKVSAKTTLKLLFIGTFLIAVAGFVVYYVVSMITAPAVVGEMKVESSDVEINPVSNILEITNSDGSEYFDALVLEDIIDDIPLVVYGGDITVNYSESTINNFTFSMYTQEGEVLYEEYDYFEHPIHAGTYIAKITFSWGIISSDYILTENYFMVQYDEAYQTCEGCGISYYHQ